MITALSLVSEGDKSMTPVFVGANRTGSTSHDLSADWRKFPRRRLYTIDGFLALNLTECFVSGGVSRSLVHTGRKRLTYSY